MRFVSFLDILGFADLVESTEVKIVIEKLQSTLSMVPVAKALGVFPNIPNKFGNFDPEKQLPALSVFSFSDTFVISSSDDSAMNFFQIVIGTSLLSKYLFAAGLPVRGAITCGEAEYIPGTAHLVGRAVIRAARLEKAQDWFGIIIDPEILTPEREQVLALPLVSPVVVSYHVPFKQMNHIPNPCRVINWRLTWKFSPGPHLYFRSAPNRRIISNGTTLSNFAAGFEKTTWRAADFTTRRAQRFRSHGYV
jgi:hypothetical protein